MHAIEPLQPIVVIQPLMVTIRQAAAMLAYSHEQIYTMLRAGEILSVGTGRGRRIPVDELQRWIAERKAPYETQGE